MFSRGFSLLTPALKPFGLPVSSNSLISRIRFSISTRSSSHLLLLNTLRTRLMRFNIFCTRPHAEFARSVRPWHALEGAGLLSCAPGFRG